MAPLLLTDCTTVQYPDSHSFPEEVNSAVTAHSQAPAIPAPGLNPATIRKRHAPEALVTTTNDPDSESTERAKLKRTPSGHADKKVQREGLRSGAQKH